MDILLTPDGDLYEQTVVVRGWRQALQSILIRTHRFRGEWLYNPQAGLNYIGWADRRTGNLVEEIKDQVASEILSVRGVLSVYDVQVRLDDNQTVYFRARVSLHDPDDPNTPVIVELDTYEGTTRVSY